MHTNLKKNPETKKQSSDAPLTPRSKHFGFAKAMGILPW
jgi:hypothetical protein